MTVLGGVRENACPGQGLGQHARRFPLPLKLQESVPEGGGSHRPEAYVRGLSTPVRMSAYLQCLSHWEMWSGRWGTPREPGNLIAPLSHVFLS